MAFFLFPLAFVQGTGRDRMTAVWKGGLVFAPRNSAEPGHDLWCCPFPWVCGCSHEVVSYSLCSDEPVPYPCQSLWDREATACRLLLLHVFMWLRVLDDSEYLSASIQIFIPSAKNSHFSLKCHFFLKIWKILLVANLNKVPSLYQLLWLLSINTKMAIEEKKHNLTFIWSAGRRNCNHHSLQEEIVSLLFSVWFCIVWPLI